MQGKKYNMYVHKITVAGPTVCTCTILSPYVVHCEETGLWCMGNHSRLLHTCSKDDQPAEEVLVAAAPHVRLPGQ